MPLLPTSEALVAPQERRGSRPSREPVSSESVRRRRSAGRNTARRRRRYPAGGSNYGDPQLRSSGLFVVLGFSQRWLHSEHSLKLSPPFLVLLLAFAANAFVVGGCL